MSGAISPATGCEPFRTPAGVFLDTSTGLWSTEWSGLGGWVATMRGGCVDAGWKVMTETYQQSVAAERHPIVSLYHVTKLYGKRPALQDVTLHIQHGEFLFMVGPSGAGKSTLMRLIYMEEFPTEGQVTVAGFVSSKMKRGKIPHLRRKVGLIFQDFKLLEDRNVHENVAFPLYVTGASNSYIKKMVMDVVSRVGLYAKRNSLPRELSGGEQQRVAIARALVNSPHVLLADEPTGNLDPDVTREILKLLFTINAAGTAVLMATHDHDLVRRYGHRIVHVEQGEIVKDEAAYGTPGVVARAALAAEDEAAATAAATERRAALAAGALQEPQHRNPAPGA
jgi:cell division transport system ATP-binding protein